MPGEAVGTADVADQLISAARRKGE